MNRCNYKAEYKCNRDFYCKKHAFGKCMITDCKSISYGKDNLCKNHSGKIRTIKSTIEYLSLYCRHSDCNELNNTIYGLCSKHKYCDIKKCFNIITVTHNYCDDHKKQNECIIEDCNNITICNVTNTNGLTCYIHTPEILLNF